MKSNSTNILTMTKLDEQYTIKGINVTVRREDKRFRPPLPPHGKMGVLNMLCMKAETDGYQMIGCFGSKYSNWVAGVPIIAARHKLKSVVCYPAKSMSACPDWLQYVFRNLHSLTKEKTGAQLHLLHPNMVTINQAQAKKYVEDKGGFFIPFGFDMPEVVNELWRQFINIPDEIGTLVLSCGSGITLAGALRAIRMTGKRVRRIDAISSGRAIGSIIETVSKYEQVTKKIHWHHPYEYADVPDIECPWSAHSHFELKAYDWLYKNIKKDKLPEPIYFMNIGADS